MCHGAVWTLGTILFVALDLVAVMSNPLQTSVVGTQTLSCESKESVSLQTCVGSQRDSMEHPASTFSSRDTYTTEKCDQTPAATDLLKPRDEAHKRELLQKGPNQPTSYNFPKKRFSNGNLSFNPSWYELKEARILCTNRMCCLSCCHDNNEPTWIRIGVSNWKKN